MEELNDLTSIGIWPLGVVETVTSADGKPHSELGFYLHDTVHNHFYMRSIYFKFSSDISCKGEELLQADEGIHTWYRQYQADPSSANKKSVAFWYFSIVHEFPFQYFPCKSIKEYDGLFEQLAERALIEEGFSDILPFKLEANIHFRNEDYVIGGIAQLESCQSHET